MSDAIHIHPVRSAEDLRAVRSLFALYAASLPIDLGYQDFTSEVAALPGKYAPPGGEILLAQDAGGCALGCVALRPIPPDSACEIKRLFVVPDTRGLGLGRSLAEAIIHEAKRIGYGDVFLDTLPTMSAAIALYRDMGFELVAPYYAPTPKGTVFLRKRLSGGN